MGGHDPRYKLVLAYEEPTLRKSFPDDYPGYVANVPRWLPRLRPWHKLKQ